MMNRAELLAAHQQVEQATADLVRVFGIGSSAHDASAVRRCIDRGALTARLPMFAWRETIQADNMELLDLLLQGSEGLRQDERVDRVRLAATYGSGAAMQAFIDRGFCQDPSLVLLDAVKHDRVEVAKVLISAGARLDFAQSHPKKGSTLSSCVQSPAMLRVLVDAGVRPTKSDMMDAALTPREGPRPDLLEAFLAAGSPMEDDSGPGHIWNVLLRSPERMEKQQDAVVACGRMLMSAGVKRPTQYAYPLPSLLAALEAGMPATEGASSVMDAWGKTSISRQQFFASSDPNEKMPRDAFLLLVARMLTRAEELGVEIDLLATQGPMKNGEWAMAFALAGVDVGIPMSFAPSIQSQADAARLRRATAPPPARPGSSRRL